MPSYTAVGTLQSQVKCLSLYNAALSPPFLESPPADWYLPGFDDSGWSGSANPSGSKGPTTLYSLPNGAPDLALAADVQEGVAPFTLTPTDETTPPYNNGFVVVVWLNRWTFTRPSTPWELYMLERYSNSLNAGGSDVYINGTLLGQVGGSGTPISIATAEAALTSGTNLLAWSTFDFWLPEFAGYHTFRLLFYTPDAGGKPVAWGTVEPGVNDQGVLGTGTAETCLVPTYMDTRNFPDPDNPQVVKIASNGRTTFLLANRGELYVCGDDDGVMHLDGAPDHAILTPVRLLVTNRDFVDVAVGGDSVLALTRTGGVYAQGINAHGSAGTGNTNSIPSFTAVLGGGRLIAAGESHSAVAQPRAMFCAGDNQYGQIGDGTTTDRLTWTFDSIDLELASGPPFNIPASEFSHVSAGGHATMVSTTQNNPPDFAWGRAEYGQLGFDVYSAGTGPNKIVSSPFNLFLSSNMELHDQVSLSFTPASPDITGLELFGQAGMGGDGVPYGGAGDGDGTIVYGTTIDFPSSVILTTPTTALENVVGIAEAGGLVNQWASGDSKATLAAISREYTLAATVNESYAGVPLLQGAGSQTHYLWPNGDGSQVYMLPDDTREIYLTVQNIAGPGAGGTVRMFLDTYDGQLPTGVFRASTSANVTVGNSVTLSRTSLNAPGFGIQAYLTYSFTPPRTNTINATLQIKTVSGTNDVLYTWGYGGYGQMGNGLTTATNLFAISENGLSNVSQVCLARRVAFAVAETGAVAVRSAGRSWATVIG